MPSRRKEIFLGVYRFYRVHAYGVSHQFSIVHAYGVSHQFSIAMAGALEPVREIYAARLMLQDETAGMPPVERAAYHKRNTEAFFTGLGLPLPKFVDLTGQGKLKPKTVSV